MLSLVVPDIRWPHFSVMGGVTRIRRIIIIRLHLRQLFKGDSQPLPPPTILEETNLGKPQSQKVAVPITEISIHTFSGFPRFVLEMYMA